MSRNVQPAHMSNVVCFVCMACIQGNGIHSILSDIAEFRMQAHAIINASTE